MTEEVVMGVVWFMVPVIYDVKEVNMNHSIAVTLTQ